MRPHSAEEKSKRLCRQRLRHRRVWKRHFPVLYTHLVANRAALRLQEADRADAHKSEKAIRSAVRPSWRSEKILGRRKSLEFSQSGISMRHSYGIDPQQFQSKRQEHVRSKAGTVRGRCTADVWWTAGAYLECGLNAGKENR